MTVVEFDAQRGRQLATAGQELAWEHSPEEWRTAAKWSLWQLAQTGREFTADDVIAAVGLPRPAGLSNNAVGALFSQAARKKIIRRVGDTTTKRKLGHARRVSLWVGYDEYPEIPQDHRDFGWLDPGEICDHCENAPGRGHVCPRCGRLGGDR